jgi:hypothetical protein
MEILLSEALRLKLFPRHKKLRLKISFAEFTKPGDFKAQGDR